VTHTIPHITRAKMMYDIQGHS